MEKKKVIKIIEKVADSFYQNRNRDGIKDMPELIENLSNMAEILNAEKQKQYCITIKNLADAYEQQNYIMVADILSFDVLGLI